MPEYTEKTPDYASLLRLDGRHILILGAGQGIGRQAALAARQLGANVSCADADASRGTAVAAEVDGLAVSGDATVRADMQRMVDEATAHFGPLHGLVDIIGVAGWSPLMECDDDAWQQGMDLNLKHVFLALQIGSRAMTEGGSIAIVGSVSGLRSSPNHAAYGAAKAGIINLAGTAALELGPAVRVNVVAPGQTATPRMKQRHTEPGYYEEAGAKVPLGRVGETSDIASALMYFLSDLSAWVTGQTLVVDGGSSRLYQYGGIS